MSNNQLLTLEKMRRERDTSQSVYVQFINSSKYYKTHAFYFYEGEDGKYYNPRIEQKFEDFITYKVQNKKEVLRLLDRITSTDLYSDVCVMFFVNRNYDINMGDYREELYETPCYSIENFYVQYNCLRKILQSEFSLNESDRDFAKCIQDYEQRAAEFNNQILEFNAIAYLGREKEFDLLFGSMKTSRIIKVEVNKVSKSPKYESIINNIKEKMKFSNREIEEAKNELINNGDFMQNFRGKNQLDFMVSFIRDLKQLILIGGYFTDKQGSVNINLTANRLSELSQYAITPHSLEIFLKKRREKFLASNAS